MGPRFEAACLLSEMGRTLEARNAYLEVLAREPGHRLALNNLGTLLHTTGYRTAARTAYAEAVAHHPDDPMSLVNLGNALYESGEFQAARKHYDVALRFDPGHAEAHQGLGYVLAELGDEDGAQRHRRKGFQDRPVFALPYRGQGPPVSLLLLISAAGGNIPTDTLLDDRVFRTFVVVPEFYHLKVPLPPHQVVFNAIGDADLAAPALAAAQAMVALTAMPVTGLLRRAGHRAELSRTPAHVPGVAAPKTATYLEEFAVRRPPPRRATASIALPVGAHARFSALLRRHFLKVERPATWPARKAQLTLDRN